MPSWIEGLIVAGAVGVASWYIGRLGWRSVMSLFGRVSPGCTSCGSAEGCSAKPSDEAGLARGCDSFNADRAA